MVEQTPPSIAVDFADKYPKSLLTPDKFVNICNQSYFQVSTILVCNWLDRCIHSKIGIKV